MKNFNHSLIVSGIALLLFGIIIAVSSQSMLSYIVGGLGLFFAIIGCFVHDDRSKKEK